MVLELSILIALCLFLTNTTLSLSVEYKKLSTRKKNKNPINNRISNLGPRQQLLAQLSDKQVDLLEQQLQNAYFRNPSPHPNDNLDNSTHY
jgi:hypothetical protein